MFQPLVLWCCYKHPKEVLWTIAGSCVESSLRPRSGAPRTPTSPKLQKAGFPFILIDICNLYPYLYPEIKKAVAQFGLKSYKEWQVMNALTASISSSIKKECWIRFSLNVLFYWWMLGKQVCRCSLICPVLSSEPPEWVRLPKCQSGSV